MHTRRFGITHLYAALPPWALAAEPRSSPRCCATRRRATACARTASILSAGNDWARIVLLDNPFWPEYARRDLAAIAAERGQAAARRGLRPARLGGLEEPHKLMVIIHAYTEEEQREAFAHPLCVPGSDATTLAPDGPLADVVLPRRLHVGRRGSGASWSASSGCSRPAAAVHKLSGAAGRAARALATAACCGEGARADVTVFDPAAFAERGTTFEPNQLAERHAHVLVNGVHTLRDGEPTGRARRDGAAAMTGTCGPRL